MARNYCGSCGACLPESATACPKCGRLFEAETAQSMLQEPDELKMLDAASDAQDAESLAENALLDGGLAEDVPAIETDAAPIQPQPGAKHSVKRPKMVAPPLENVPHYARNTAPQTSESLSFSDVFAMLMVAQIPIVGLVMLCIWGFGENNSVSRRNLARAILLVQIVMGLLFFVGAFFVALVQFGLFVI